MHSEKMLKKMLKKINKKINNPYYNFESEQLIEYVGEVYICI